MKKIIIIAIVVVILAAGIMLFIFSSGQRGVGTVLPSSPSSTGSLPSVGTSTITAEQPTGTVLQIGTASGTVTINNFYNNPVQVSQDQKSIVIVQTSTYNITYYAPDSSFNIGIIKGPVPTVRAAAEAAFLSTLGISQADACKLNVMVGVPYDVDPNYADQNLGLSFCESRAF